MATATYTVKKGDTLSEIASKYYSTYGTGYSNWKTYMNKLAEINKISNVNLIYVGQTLKLSGAASTPSTSSTARSVTIRHFGLQANTDSTLFVMWEYSRENTENYQVQWSYKAGGKWFDGSDSTTTSKQSTYNYPSNAEEVRVRVKPISKKYTKNNKEYSYYTGQWTSYKTYDVGINTPVPVPVVPSVKLGKYKKATNAKTHTTTKTEPATVNVDGYNYINGVKTTTSKIVSFTDTVIAYKIIASVDDYSVGMADAPSGYRIRIRFDLYKKDSSGEKLEDTEYSDVSSGYPSLSDKGHAEVTFKDLDQDAEYRVRCCAQFYNKNNNKIHRSSEYTDYSDYIKTTGITPKSLECYDIKRTSENTFDVYLKWAGLDNVTYNVEYTTNPDYFDSGGNTQSITGLESPNCIAVGLSGGETYYFRIQSVNEAGESGWSSSIYVTLGEKPTAPTTWSSTNSIILGEEATLYWMHNSIDGSKQKHVEIGITVNNGEEAITYMDTSTNDDPINYYLLKTVDDNGDYIYPDGATIRWRVRTAGVLTENNKPVYSDFSMVRTIEVRVQPKLAVHIADSDSIDITEVTSFPFFVITNVTEGKENQTPIMYHLAVTANDTYDTVDGAGNNKIVREGEAIYSMHFDPSGPEFYETDDDGNTTWNPYELRAMISANNIDLENSISYTITCTVTMDSGLTGSGSADMVVSWGEIYYEPDAEVVVDNDIYATYIRPYCGKKPYYKVEYSSEIGGYVKTDDLIPPLEGDTLTRDRLIPQGRLELNEEIIETSESTVYSITKSFNEYRLDVTAAEGEDRVLRIKLSPGYYVVNILSLSDSIYVDNTLYSMDDLNGGAVAHYKSYSGFINDGIYINSVGSYSFYSIEKYTVDPNPIIEYTFTDDLIYEAEDGTLFCVGDNPVIDDDILLSVYRRDFDGSFTELAVDLDNTGLSYVTDPHPALNHARYRIVAKSKTTGSVSYADLPDIPIGGNAIVIQWDEKWTDYEMDNYNESETPAWAGSMLVLPYNVDVSDSYNTDVSLVNYIGRKRPVSYYGTHLDEKSSWSTEIPADDHVTLNLLRRLAIYTGDVYVREPSGSGYWANVKVTFSQTHCEVTIPVTFDITRVEGGV